MRKATAFAERAVSLQDVEREESQRVNPAWSSSGRTCLPCESTPGALMRLAKAGVSDADGVRKHGGCYRWIRSTISSNSTRSASWRGCVPVGLTELGLRAALGALLHGRGTNPTPEVEIETTDFLRSLELKPEKPPT